MAERRGGWGWTSPPPLPLLGYQPLPSSTSAKLETKDKTSSVL